MSIYYSEVYVEGQTHGDDEKGMIGGDLYFSNSDQEPGYSGIVGSEYDRFVATNNYIKKLFTTDYWWNPKKEDYDTTPAFLLDENSVNYLFSGCLNETIPDLEKIVNIFATDFTNMFSNCPNLKSVDCSTFDMSIVKAIDSMFENCPSLEFVDISGGDVHNIGACAYCFANCPNLREIKCTNGTNWQAEMDLRSETRIENIFENSYSLPNFSEDNIGIYAANDGLWGGYFRHPAKYETFEVYEKFDDSWSKAQLKEKASNSWRNATPKMLIY